MKTGTLRAVARKKTWQLQDAKNRLSRLVEDARHEGPQTITVRGKEAVVVLSVEEFEKLTRPRSSLMEFLRQSPLKGFNLDLKRRKDISREVKL